MVRIYKVNRVSLKSKKYCKENPGESPPALEPVLKKRQSFEQIHGLSLEDASEAWELAGDVLRSVRIYGGTDDDLDRQCCNECNLDTACTFWVREAGSKAYKSCWLKTNPG